MKPQSDEKARRFDLLDNSDLISVKKSRSKLIYNVDRKGQKNKAF